MGRESAPPYARKDWRARLRRTIERCVPDPLVGELRRVELAMSLREPLHRIPKHVRMTGHDAWITEADIRRGEELVREGVLR
jgi:hypothetical protein